MSEPRRQLQKWVRQVLSEHGWSAEEWGRRAGTSATNITRLLQAGTTVPTAATIAKLANASGSEPTFVRSTSPDALVPILSDGVLSMYLKSSKAQQVALAMQAKETGVTIRTTRPRSDRCIAVEIACGSLNARGIEKGDVASVEPPDVVPIVPGSIAVAVVNGIIGAYLWHPPMLVPASHDLGYAPVSIRADNVQVVGRMVEYRRVLV